jgi:hypothetical protein
MSRPPLEVADLVRSAGKAFIERNRQWLRWTHLKVLLAIVRCRTAALGGHIEECTGCGHRAAISYNSCRNRHCPKCQIGARERWIQARRRELLPSPYVHVVFTLPHPLASLALQNKKLIYGLLLCASAEPYWKWLVTPDISGPRSASSACSIPGTRNSSFILTSTVSSPQGDSRPITPAGFDPGLASFSLSRYSAVSFAASSSPVSSQPFNRANFIFAAIWHCSRNLRPSLPGSGNCSERTGSSTPNHPSAAPNMSSSIWAATLIAWPSPTIGWSRWPTDKSPFVGATPLTTTSKN